MESLLISEKECVGTKSTKDVSFWRSTHKSHRRHVHPTNKTVDLWRARWSAMRTENAKERATCSCVHFSFTYSTSIAQNGGFPLYGSIMLMSTHNKSEHAKEAVCTQVIDKTSLGHSAASNSSRLMSTVQCTHSRENGATRHICIIRTCIQLGSTEHTEEVERTAPQKGHRNTPP